MPIVTVPITPGRGPLIDIAIGISGPRAEALKQAGKPVPHPIRVRGLIDTGASCTCIDPSIVQALQLTPTGVGLQYTPSTGDTPAQANLFDVSFFWVATTYISYPILSVVESTLANQGIQVLIGRDALEPCLVVYDGIHQICTISF